VSTLQELTICYKNTLW